MQQLHFHEPGVVRWEEVEAPKLASAEAVLVRPLTVALCDLDTAALKGTFPFAGPYPFGHEGVAEVVEVGDAVTSVAVGDQVIVPFQISCGDCASCRRGRTGNCRSHPMMSTYGLGQMGGLQWGGLLADLALVPHGNAMLVPVPEGVDPVAIASLSDNIPDAWRCVGPQLRDEPEAEVLVVGGDGGPKSIGLYAAGLAVAAGASRVVYIDTDEDRAGIAASLGAEVSVEAPPKKAGSFAITVDASGSQAGLACAINSTARDGWCTSPSVYLGDQAMPLLQMYSRCCTFHTGRVHARPAIPEVLELIAEGFDPGAVTSQVVSFDEAEAAMMDPPMKLVLQRA